MLPFSLITLWVAQLLNNIIVWIVSTNFWEWTRTKPFLHLSLGKAVPFTLESNICVKALKRKVFQIIRCLIKLFLKNSTRQFFKGGPHEWLSYSIIQLCGWYSIVSTHFWEWKKTKPFLHLSLGKAGPFTSESHICVKALKCNVFQIIRCLIKLFLKNSTQTIFQGGTPWVAQILNNITVWMALYCGHQLLGGRKKQNPFSTFLWVKLVPLL